MIAIIISVIIIISTFSNINNSFIYLVDNIDVGYIELYRTRKVWLVNYKARWENDRLIFMKVFSAYPHDVIQGTCINLCINVVGWKSRRRKSRRRTVVEDVLIFCIFFLFSKLCQLVNNFTIILSVILELS